VTSTRSFTPKQIIERATAPMLASPSGLTSTTRTSAGLKIALIGRRFFAAGRRPVGQALIGIIDSDWSGGSS